MDAKNPLAQLLEVGVRLGDTQVLRDVDFAVTGGEAIGLMGANGSGKTTLLRVLATLLVPTTGTGRVLGADLTDEARFDVRCRIALIGHQPSLYPELSLEANLAFVARILGRSNTDAHRALDLVGLGAAAGRRAERCSKGMLRRADFARVLLTKPDLLLLDEAHAGLDEAAAGLVGELVRNVTGRGGAAVVVSHEPERIRGIVDRTHTLSGGFLGAAA